MFEIGIDCEEIKRFDQNFLHCPSLNKLFSPAEINYCNTGSFPQEHFAGKFAAKEAVIKAFSQMGRSIYMNQIEILNNNDGCPICHILDDKCSGHLIKISITHSKEMVMAIAIIVRQGSE